MFNYTETYTIITRTFIYLKGKNVPFSSFIETGLSGSIVLHCSRSSSNFIVDVSIFLARFGPTFVKNLLKVLAICVSSVIIICCTILSIITFLGKFWLLHLTLPIESLIISQVFLILFLKVSINLEKWFFVERLLIASNNL